MIKPFKDEPKVSVLLKTYPKYKLYGRVLEVNLDKFNKTKDESLIIYKYCKNEPNMILKDYYSIITERKRKEKEEYRAFRLSQGFTSL